MPRKPHTHHYIYKTTCKVTGKFYIGMHSTSDLDDNYIGSGKVLWYSIKKYGRENHEKEILEWLPSREELSRREKEIVTRDIVSNELCMNLIEGGGQSWRSPDTNKNISDSLIGRNLSDSHRKAISEGCKGINTAPKTEEHRHKLAVANIGKKQEEEICTKRSEALRKFWQESSDAEEARKKKSESLKKMWEERKNNGKKRKSPVRKKLSMTPGAIKMREKRTAIT